MEHDPQRWWTLIPRGVALLVLILSLVAVREGTAKLGRIEAPSDNIFNLVLIPGEQDWGVYGREGLCLGVVRSRLVFKPEIELALSSVLRVEKGGLFRLNLTARFSQYRLLESLDGRVVAGNREITITPEKGGWVVVAYGTAREHVLLPQPTILLEQDGKPRLSLARALARRFDPVAIRTVPLNDRVSIAQCEEEAVRASGLNSEVFSRWLATV